MNKAPEGMMMAGRIAFREEGRFWVAYYAKPDTMEDAIPPGSLAMGLAATPELKQAFMELMRVAVSFIFIDKIGGKPTWLDPSAAPDHERTKKA